MFITAYKDLDDLLHHSANLCDLTVSILLTTIVHSSNTDCFALSSTFFPLCLEQLLQMSIMGHLLPVFRFPFQ